MVLVAGSLWFSSAVHCYCRTFGCTVYSLRFTRFLPRCRTYGYGYHALPHAGCPFAFSAGFLVTHATRGCLYHIHLVWFVLHRLRLVGFAHGSPVTVTHCHYHLRLRTYTTRTHATALRTRLRGCYRVYGCGSAVHHVHYGYHTRFWLRLPRVTAGLRGWLFAVYRSGSHARFTAHSSLPHHCRSSSLLLVAAVRGCGLPRFTLPFTTTGYTRRLVVYRTTRFAHCHTPRYATLLRVLAFPTDSDTHGYARSAVVAVCYRARLLYSRLLRFPVPVAYCLCSSQFLPVGFWLGSAPVTYRYYYHTLHAVTFYRSYHTRLHTTAHAVRFALRCRAPFPLFYLYVYCRLPAGSAVLHYTRLPAAHATVHATATTACRLCITTTGFWFFRFYHGYHLPRFLVGSTGLPVLYLRSTVIYRLLFALYLPHRYRLVLYRSRLVTHITHARYTPFCRFRYVCRYRAVLQVTVLHTVYTQLHAHTRFTACGCLWLVGYRFGCCGSMIYCGCTLRLPACHARTYAALPHVLCACRLCRFWLRLIHTCTVRGSLHWFVYSSACTFCAVLVLRTLVHLRYRTVTGCRSFGYAVRLLRFCRFGYVWLHAFTGYVATLRLYTIHNALVATVIYHVGSLYVAWFIPLHHCGSPAWMRFCVVTYVLLRLYTFTVIRLPDSSRRAVHAQFYTTHRFTTLDCHSCCRSPRVVHCR